ncbi:MAG TPA: RNA polymerase sigma factor RpoH [Steroidobacteraceae bacterium]|nr:RNA polymerase sigma factor RpoH [Steroidobacteraceae bacterium]
MSAQTAMMKHVADLGVAGPLGSFDAYVDRVSRVPVLSREEEQRLARRFREEDDLDAARQLVLSHLRFVVHIARGYNGYGLPMNDLVQEGNVGLMKAVKRFDPAVGVRLVSFAVHWIRAEIHEYVLRNWRLVRIATTKAQRKLFFNLRRLKPTLSWLSADETRAVAKDLGVPPAEVTEMEQRLSAHDLSFDPLPAGEEEESYGPAAYLGAPDADPAKQIEAEDWDGDSSAQLSSGLESLDERSRTIVQRRWLASPKATLHELAAEYGVSAERIRQIEASAFTRLRGLLPAPSV